MTPDYTPGLTRPGSTMFPSLHEAFHHADGAVLYTQIVLGTLQRVGNRAAEGAKRRAPSPGRKRNELNALRTDLQRLAGFAVRLLRCDAALSRLPDDVHSRVAACYPVTAPPIRVWGDECLTGLEAAAVIAFRVIDAVRNESDLDEAWKSFADESDDDLIEVTRPCLFTRWPSEDPALWEGMRHEDLPALRFVLRRERAATCGFFKSEDAPTDLLSYRQAAHIAGVHAKTIERWASGATPRSLATLTAYMLGGIRCVSERELREKLPQLHQRPRVQK